MLSLQAFRFFNRRFAASQMLVMATYLLAGKLGLALAVINASASGVWPPTGIAIASVLVFGPRVWIGIFLGAFLVTNSLQDHL